MITARMPQQAPFPGYCIMQTMPGVARMSSKSHRPCAARCCAYQPRTVWASKGMPVILEYCSQTRRYCSSEIELPSAPAIPLGIPLAGPLVTPPAPCTVHSGERQLHQTYAQGRIDRRVQSLLKLSSLLSPDHSPDTSEGWHV